jgi:phage repressor protein C with HTH and peptisase S24 domain
MKDCLLFSGTAMIELMEAVHARGLPFRFTAGGHSMAPFIKDGDVISVSPLSSRLPGRGEVVAFLHPETKSLCVHRVLSATEGDILIQGDNVPGKPDGVIPPEDILGRVTRVERKGRKVRFCLGPERFLIALLSHSGLLAVIKRYAGPAYRSFSRRHMI